MDRDILDLCEVCEMSIKERCEEGCDYKTKHADYCRTIRRLQYKINMYRKYRDEIEYCENNEKKWALEKIIDKEA